MARDPDISAALDLLIGLWRDERAAERQKFREERALIPWKERVARGLALADLVIDEAFPAPGGRLVLCVHPSKPGPLAFDRHTVRLRAGDPVVLFQQSPDEPAAVPAVVERWRGAALGVAIDGELPDAFEEGTFRLEREAPEATFQRGELALSALKDARAETLESLKVVYGNGRLEHVDVAFEAIDKSLDEVQRDAVAHALATSPMACIHGPPGTGKTRSLIEVIRQARARGWRVLASAASNVAVDNLAERLIAAGLPTLRIGHPARVLPSVEDHTLDARIDASDASRLAKQWVSEATALKRKTESRAARGTIDRFERREAFAEANRLFKDARMHLRRVEHAIVELAPIVCCTLAGADHPALRGQRFDVVVLDEATQAPDPLAWIALRMAPRAVLAGDPNQLPPTIIDPSAARRGLSTTVFERLVAKHGSAVVRMLVTQHRMHASIMAFPSLSLYDGRLVAHPAVAAHSLADLGVAADPLRDGPLVFVDIAGAGWSDDKREGDASTRNKELAERTAREVRRLLSRGLQPAQLAVLTPYDAQVGELRQRLADVVTAGLEVGSIDGFQGREKEAIVVDLVRSNDDADIGFLSDVRRMNVALTRARRFLLVIGDSATIGGHPFYAAFLEAIEAYGTWVSSFADEAPDL